MRLQVEEMIRVQVEGGIVGIVVKFRVVVRCVVVLRDGVMRCVVVLSDVVVRCVVVRCVVVSCVVVRCVVVVKVMWLAQLRERLWVS